MAEIGAIAAVFAVYALLSARLAGTPITGPMVFVGAGLLFGFGGIGHSGAESQAAGGVDGLLATSEVALTLANVTLAVLLFADARHADVWSMRREALLPLRLLAIGLPATILLGGVAAAATFGHLEIWAALLLATIIAPTDLALGQAVVGNRRVPAQIREALNVEGGLNDGLALPFFTVFIALAAEREHLSDTPLLNALAEKVGFGLAVGLLIGGVGGCVLAAAARRGYADPLFQQLGLVAMAVLTWWATEEVHGSGFIGAFVAGAAAARTTRGVGGDDEASEGISQALMLVVFFLFGASTAQLFDDVTAAVVVYAVLALTVLRMVPVAVCTIAAGLDWRTVAYLGWFGPRGLATVVFALLALTEEPALSGMDTIVVTAMITVLISVFAHGLTAAPLSERYARRCWAAEPPSMVPVDG